jgi:pyruvate dehydrogenase kinase 2/3/4
MRDMPSVLGVKQLYTNSFRDLIEFEDKIITSDHEERFSRLVDSIYHRHSKVLVQMARGAYEFRDAIRLGQFATALPPGKTYDHMESTHEFLDRFYLCRIGIRVLIGQYLALRQPPVPHYIGIICSQTSPYEIVKRAIDDASFMCNRKYGDAPDVIVTGRLDQTFPYVPTHLRTLVSKFTFPDK